MNEYRFTLQKYKRGSKLSCPQCGKKQCFIRYVDTQGEVSFPDYVGRCDHEQSCKYHYTPSDYFFACELSRWIIECYRFVVDGWVTI